MTRTGAQEALAGNDDRYGFIGRLHFMRRLFGLFNHRSARIGKTLRCRFDFLGRLALQCAVTAENFLESGTFFSELRELFLNGNGRQAGKLLQANFKNIVGLTVREAKLFDEIGLRIIRIANNGNHAVNIEEHKRPAFQHVNAVEHLLQTRL